VQRAVAANAGISYAGWAALLSHAARNALSRVRAFGNAGTSSTVESAPAPLLQALFELQRASRLLRALLVATARAARLNALAAVARRRLVAGAGGLSVGALQARVVEVSLGGGSIDSSGGIDSSSSKSAAAAAAGNEEASVADLPLGPLETDDLATLPQSSWVQLTAGLLGEGLSVLALYGAAG